jgi:hypothetical protein
MAACSALMNETSVYGSSSNPNALYVTAHGVPISTNFGTRPENFDDTAILSAIHKVKTSSLNVQSGGAYSGDGLLLSAPNLTIVDGRLPCDVTRGVTVATPKEGYTIVNNVSAPVDCQYDTANNVNITTHDHMDYKSLYSMPHITKSVPLDNASTEQYGRNRVEVSTAERILSSSPKASTALIDTLNSVWNL